MDHLLQVEDALRALQGAEGAPGQLRIADADHAAALGAEQRLDHHVAAQHVERLQGGVGVLADHRRRHAQAGRFAGNAVVRYLSTQISTARGGLRTVTPWACTRWSRSMRKITCSSEPGGMVRTRMAS